MVVVGRALVIASIALSLGVACSDDSAVEPEPITVQTLLDAPTSVTLSTSEVGEQVATITPGYRRGPDGQPLLIMPEVRVRHVEPGADPYAGVATVWAIVDGELSTFVHPVPGQDVSVLADASEQRRRRYFKETRVAYAAGARVVFAAMVTLPGVQRLVRSEAVTLSDPHSPPAGVVLFQNVSGGFLNPDLGAFVVSGPDHVFSWTDEAARFSVPENGEPVFALSRVRVPVQSKCVPACPGPLFTVSVYDDAGGGPGVELEIVPATMDSETPALISVSFSGQTMLNAGETYWVVLKGVGDSHHLWLQPAAATNTGRRMLRTDYLWRSGAGDPAFAVTGDPE
jgi:hypothetical protein